MTSNYKKIEKDVLALSPLEKSALLRTLIDSLQTSTDPQAKQLWVTEVKQRYQAYVAGELKAVLGEEAMRKARGGLAL